MAEKPLFDLDALLRQERLRVPDDFSALVMREIEREALAPGPSVQQLQGLHRWARAGAAVAGAAASAAALLFALLQLIGFSFGIWFATSAH